MLIGHTGNYLLVKVPGDESLLHQTITVKLIGEEGMYMVGTFVSSLPESSILC